MLTGGCCCGAIRYEARGAPFHETNRHCSVCRRTTGAPFVSWFSVRSDDFRLIKGEPIRFNSTGKGTRTFCPNRGTQLTFKHADFPDEIDVTTGSLDDPKLAPPHDNTRTSSRLPWIMLSGLPDYLEGRTGGVTPSRNARRTAKRGHETPMLAVHRETPRQNDIALLLKQSDDLAARLYPGEYRQQLDPGSLDAAGIHVLVARTDSVAVGCCALIERSNGTAELKRMLVDEDSRRQGVGMALLQAVELAASILGIHLIQMEVGVRNTDGQGSCPS